MTNLKTKTRVKTIFSEDEDQIPDTDETMEKVELSNKTSVSVFTKFANIFLNDKVCTETITPIIDFIIGANLSDDPNLDLDVINLFINTEGGDLHEAFKLIDAIRMSEIPVRTIGWGCVASAGLLIFMTGKERFFSKNCSILSHNATFNVDRYSIRVNDFSHFQEFKLVIDRIIKTYMECTGKSEKYIKKHLLLDNDVYLSAEDAIRHGIGDGILPKGISWLSGLTKSDDQETTTEASLDIKPNI